MKANELMIDDLVYCHQPECKGHRIDYIHDADEEVGADGEIYSINDIDPIPLTQEILEKNGFEEDGEGVYGDDNSFFIPIYQNGFIGMWETHIEPTEGMGDFSGKLKYVHQLQHAFKLCGIEKEINNL